MIINLTYCYENCLLAYNDVGEKKKREKKTENSGKMKYSNIKF